MKDLNGMISDLYKMLASIADENEIADLLEDLCTYKEVEQMAQRLRAAKLLMENKTYSQTISETGISSATLSRVSKCVKHGRGYSKFI